MIVHCVHAIYLCLIAFKDLNLAHGIQIKLFMSRILHQTYQYLDLSFLILNFFSDFTFHQRNLLKQFKSGSNYINEYKSDAIQILQPFDNTSDYPISKQMKQFCHKTARFDCLGIQRHFHLGENTFENNKKQARKRIISILDTISLYVHSLKVCHSSAFQTISIKSVYIKIINYCGSIVINLNDTMQTKQHAMKKPHTY